MIGGIAGIYFREPSIPAPRPSVGKAVEVLFHGRALCRVSQPTKQVHFGRMALPFYPGREHGFFPTLHNCTITASCIIRNKRELAGILELPLNAEDSLLILKAYLKWGHGCLDRLEGKFAFAIWDENSQELFCAKSSTGGVDLVYYCDNKRFIFGTQVKSVISLLERQPELNSEFIAEFLDDITGNIYSTAYQDIVHLPPGYSLTVNRDRVVSRPFWEPQYHDRIILRHDQDYVEAASSILTEILLGYLDSGLKPGLQTGGGLKTACIASHLNPLLHDPLAGVSYVLPENYAGDLSDERAYTDLLASHLKMDLHYVNEPVFPTPYDEDIERKMRQQDSMVVNPVGSDHYFVYGKMKELGVHLCFTPDSKSIDWSGADAVARMTASGHFMGAWRLNRKFGGSFLHAGIYPVMPASLIHFYRICFKKERADFMSHPDVLARHGIIQKMEAYRIGLPGTLPTGTDQLSSVQRRLAFSKKYVSAQEYRYDFVMINPLSDRRLIDFSLSLPPKQFALNGNKRSLVKRMLKERVPPKIYELPTMESYPADMRDRWLHAKPFLLEQFEAIPANSVVWNYVNKRVAEKIFHEIKTSEQYRVWRQNRHKLNRIVLLERFLKFDILQRK